MSDQLDLFGVQPPCDDRLFLGVVPARPLGERLAELADQWRTELNLTGRPFTPDRLHLSLYALGDYPGVPRQLVDNVRQAGDALKLPPFEITLDRVMSFYRRDRKRALVLRPSANIAALLEFHRLLGEYMTGVGLGRWVSPHFTPHMTLLYDRRMIAERPVARVQWRIDGFVLIHSLLRRHRYGRLGQWELDG